MSFDVSMITQFACDKFSVRSSILAIFSAALLTFLPSTAAFASGELTPQAQEAAKLMGIEDQVYRLLEYKKTRSVDNYDQETLGLQLSLVRKIMTTGLELRSASAKFDREITFEQQALDKLTRERDLAVSLTTNANFLQLSILSTIIDGPLEQTKNRHMILNGNRLNIVSGLTVGSLALLALYQQRGGTRHSKPEANLLGQTLGLEAPDSEKLSPILWQYLNSPATDAAGGLTRRQQLTEYWETAKILPINIKKTSTVEQVSALGARHRQRYESIKLLTARVTMLFDLRAMSNMLNTGLVELLQALD